MELICPSCEARYQVPDASVGEKGRQVSCMSCGHSWHAFPPLMLGSSAAPPTTASPGIDYQTPPRPGRSSSMPAYAPSFPEAEAPPTVPAPGPAPGQRAPEAARGAEPSRSEQLAEIREMLAEVQSEERAAAALTPDDGNRTRVPLTKSEARAAPPEPAEAPDLTGPSGLVPESGPRRDPVTLRDIEDEDEGADPLRRRMAIHDKQSDRRRTDVERLRRRHERRAGRQKRVRDAGSGAFLTGFLLVVMVAAVMTALYMLQPQIVARMPGTEPMMTEYVTTVDGVRVRVAETYDNARVWVLRLFDKNA